MQSNLLASIDEMQWQVAQMSLALAAKGERGVDSVEPEASAKDGSKQPAPTFFMNIVELENRIKTVYEPQITTMQQQITALMKLVEYMQNQLKAQNTQ